MQLGRRRSLYLTAWLATLVVTSSPARAQDLEAFSLNDFVAPSILELFGDGDEARSKLLTVREDFGGVLNYQSRAEFTERNLLFARVAINGYFGNWQVGSELLAFEPGDVLGDERDSMANGRADLHVARYFKQGTIRVARKDKEDDPEEVEVYTRLRLAVEIDNQIARRETYGLSADYQTFLFDIISSWSYTWLNGREDERDQHYLSITGHGVIERFKKVNGSAIMGIGLGAERTEGHSKLTGLRLEMGVVFPFPKLRGAELRLVYAPAFQPRNRDHGSGVNHEVSLLFSPVVFSKLFTPGASG